MHHLIVDCCAEGNASLVMRQSREVAGVTSSHVWNAVVPTAWVRCFSPYDTEKRFEISLILSAYDVREFHQVQNSAQTDCNHVVEGESGDINRQPDRPTRLTLKITFKARMGFCCQVGIGGVAVFPVAAHPAAAVVISFACPSALLRTPRSPRTSKFANESEIS